MARDALPKSGNLTFTIKPRIFKLLGDQLIRDATLAVFELVKNAYDADARTCNVTLNHPDDPSKASIIIQDDGSGMDENILRNVWMVIATDFRADQREKKTRSPIFHRFPLGEKGLGRFSVHKLGMLVRMVTRKKDGDELVLEFDWNKLEESSELSQAFVKIRRRKPTVFRGQNHGTRIEALRLREKWTRGEVRHLYRAVNSLCSPFDGPSDFAVSLSVPERKEWIANLPTVTEVNQSALYYIRGSFEGVKAEFEYEFRPPQKFRKQLATRIQKVEIPVLNRKGLQDEPKVVFIDLSSHQIGKVEFEFRLYDRDPAVLSASTDDIDTLRRYLSENGGIRIYRDGIRVYDFGEHGNDWLNLDLRRVNSPTAKISNNQILGTLRLDATASDDLREKSNREGFIEGNAYKDFRDAVLAILIEIEAERVKDQKRLREILGKGTGQKIFAKLTELREVLESKGVLNDVEPRLKEVEREMETYRDQLLHAAVPGLTLGIMVHGAEKILDELRTAARKGADLERIKELVDRLYRAMRPVTNLLKNPGIAKTTASSLIKEARFSADFRLKAHNIELIEDIEEDFPVEGSKQMLIASITNLIDNAIHWLEIKNPSQKLLYVGVVKDLEGGPAIVVADNGPGFGHDNPQDLITPFFTRRNGGMGLGLYIVSEVMRVNNARLAFPENTALELPVGIDGAVVALQFSGI